MITSPRLALSCVLVLCASACDFLPTGKESSPANVATFTYDGRLSGTFRAQGLPRDDDPAGRAYAVGYSQPMEDAIDLHAFAPTTGSRGDRLFLRVPDEPGTYPFGCRAGTRCVVTGIRFELENPTNQPHLQYQRMLMRDGELKVARVTRTRVSGEFSGTAFLGDGPIDDGSPVAVTRGEFDVERRGPQPVSFQAHVPGGRP